MLLITGANGQLGSCLKELFSPEQALFTDAAELDITNQEAVHAFGQAHTLSAIINCAGYTNVDKAEEEPSLARAINALGTENLAKLAGAKNIPLVHISTDYVFDGVAHQPLSEKDPTRPLGVYGQTKLEGELAALQHAPTTVILRTAWLYSPYGKNFVKTMWELGRKQPNLRVVSDQFGTPTYAPHLAQAIAAILPQIKPGTREIYHFTDEGCASWYDLAYYVIKTAGLDCQVSPISASEYPAQARRPAFGVLNKAKFKRDFKMSLPHWTQGVEKCLKKLS